MTPALFCILEVKMQTGGMCLFGRIHATVEPAETPSITGSLRDALYDEDARWLLPGMQKGLTEGCEEVGASFHVHLERMLVHPVDSRPLAFELLVRSAVRLATKHGLGGTWPKPEPWSPAPWFRVHCCYRLPTKASTAARSSAESSV